MNTYPLPRPDDKCVAPEITEYDVEGRAADTTTDVEPLPEKEWQLHDPKFWDHNGPEQDETEVPDPPDSRK